MNHHLNVKIINAITDSEYEQSIKEFLISALLLEFDKADQTRPRVKDEYERLIKKGAAKMGGKQ